MVLDPLTWSSGFRTDGIADALARRGAMFLDGSRDWGRAPLRANLSLLCPEVAIADAPTVRILLPPRMERLSSSQDFAAVNFTAALGAAVGDAVEICSYQLTDGLVGFLQQMSIYVLAPTPAAQVSFELRIGGGPVPGYSDIRNPPTNAAMLYLPRNDLQLRVGISQRVSLVARNLGGGALTVGGELSGWEHPETAEAAAWGLRL